MDSLRHYSYYIHGAQETADGQSLVAVDATCFFVRVPGHTFLVSAKHVLSSWSSSDAHKPAFYPDTLYIRLPVGGSNEFTDYPVDISKLKQEVTGGFYYEDPDVLAIAFPQADSLQINSIADITMAAPAKGVSASGIIYGYPHAKPAFLEGRLFSSPNENLSYRDHKREVDVRDHINYLFSCNSDVAPGYSGAPVFLKNDGSDTWYFAGLVSQGVPGNNYFFYSEACVPGAVHCIRPIGCKIICLPLLLYHGSIYCGILFCCFK